MLKVLKENLISNPNYGDGNKTIFANIQATEIDRVKDFGYKSNKLE